MCGIVGIYNKNEKVEFDLLIRMSNSIVHRGPDGEGHWIEHNVGLGHRRLSIIDLTENAAQPMHSLYSDYVIILNGEIYNYLEIKSQLIKSGYKFKSNSDTEVLLNLYIEKKEKCLDDLDGMFAFAIYDRKAKTLFCARDRFGEKPFYYYYEPGKIFIFASEIKALKAYGIPLEFLPHRVLWYFNDKYAVNNPENIEETFYKKIYKLEPGYYIVLGKNILISKKKYWDIKTDNINWKINFEDAKSNFLFLFNQSVSKRLRADVIVGTSLSGGLDSSSIVCTIENILSGTGNYQKTFSARFKNFDKDEGDFIEEVIKGKNLKAYYTWPEADTLFEKFDRLMFYQEEPVGTANQFSQLEVMKLAKSEHVTVLLDGQGADEVVTGYSHYFDVYYQELQKKFPILFEDELNSYIKNINPNYKFILNDVIKEPIIGKIKRNITPYYSKFLKPLLPKNKNHQGLIDYDFCIEAYKMGRFGYYGYNEGLNKALYYDAKKGNLEALLRYGDKNSMAYSREVRLPFLNHHLVEFLFTLPPWFKIHNGWSKYILREAMQNILPEKIQWRKDKIGYQTPQENWLNNKAFKNLINEAIYILKDYGILNNQKSDFDIKNKEWQILNLAFLLKTFK